MARGRSRNKRTNTKRSAAMSKYEAQAGTETALRYGPQLSALQELMAQTRQTKSDAIHRGRDRQLYEQSVLGAQRPQLDQVFADAERRVNTPIPGPAAVGPGSSAISQALAGSQASSQQMFGAMKASALSGLVGRQTEAFDRGRNSETAARGEYADSVAKIGRQRRQLNDEAGLFNVDALNKILQAAGQRALTRRGQDVTRANALTSARTQLRGQRITDENADLSRAVTETTSAETRRHNAAMERKAATKAKDKGKGKDWLNRNQTNNAVKNVTEAQAWIKKLSGLKDKNGRPWSSTQIRQALTTGHQFKGKDKNGVLQTQTVPKFDKTLAVNPAFDLHTLNGKLSPANTRALHDAGIHIPRNWRFKGAPRRPSSQRYGGK